MAEQQYDSDEILSQALDYIEEQEESAIFVTQNTYRIPIQNSQKNLCEMTIGLLGVGGMGKGVARVCNTFGMTVWGFTKRTVMTETAYADRSCSAKELCALGRMLPPDVVTVYVCLTPNEFRSLFTLKFTKENAVLLSLDSFGDSELKEFEEGDLVSRVEYYYGSLPVLARYWRKLTALKWAHTIWNGVDELTKAIDAHQPKPKCLLTRTLGSVNAGPVSEYVIGQIIARERGFFKFNNLQVKSLEDRIPRQSSQKNLCAMTIGLLGVGGIGKGVARVCKTFGMTVWGFTKRTVMTETACPHVDKYVTKERLPELLHNCDYVCCMLPDTPDTDDLLSGDILTHCKNKKSVLINVGRGNVIDEATIVKAINEGWLGGAILDVFRSEPLPPSSPLWSLPGVTITPHMSGWTWGDDHVNKVHACFLENYRRYAEGAPLLGVVDWERGY